jgi:hypothetical protein
MKEVILRLGSGSLETGFPSVNVELRDRSHGSQQSHWESTASLLPAPELKDIYEEWQLLYQNSLQQSSQRGITIDWTGITHFSEQDVQQITHNLLTALNSWLNQGDFYYKIQAQLRTELNTSDQIVLAIVTDNLLLWQLPWHRWNFFDSYQHCVEFFSKPQFKNLSRQPQRNGKVDILALWGNAPELNLAKDLAALQQPRAVVKSCQPESAIDISNQLAAQQIDILFFGGHGETIELDIAGNPQTFGAIYLDKETSIEIDKIKKDLQQAVDRGLQIAIFNCCSGLGLAQELADLNIPYLIVMRSQISDQLAQQFCRDLLLRYSQGASFPAAFQYARERLKPATDRSDEFESWLPMLLHNPNSNHVTWQQLCHSWWHFSIPPVITRSSKWLTEPRHKPITWLGTSLVSTSIAIGLQTLTPLQNLEAVVLDKFQASQVAIMPPESHVVIVDISTQSNKQDGRVIIGEEFVSGDKFLKDFSKISFLALGIDIKIVNVSPDSFLNKSNISLNCSDAPPAVNYVPEVKGCPALAWAVTKHYPQKIHHDQRFVLNPHLANVIPKIGLDKLVANPTLYADKILLVGAVSNQSSPVVLHAIATEQIIRSTIAKQLLPVLPSNYTKVIYLWCWSSLSGILIFTRRLMLLLSATTILVSVGTGFLLFAGGFLVPLTSSLIAIGIGSMFIFLIHASNLQNNY